MGTKFKYLGMQSILGNSSKLKQSFDLEPFIYQLFKVIVALKKVICRESTVTIVM